jgi:hypothetical protein
VTGRTGRSSARRRETLRSPLQRLRWLREGRGRWASDEGRGADRDSGDRGRGSGVESDTVFGVLYEHLDPPVRGEPTLTGAASTCSCRGWERRELHQLPAPRRVLAGLRLQRDRWTLWTPSSRSASPSGMPVVAIVTAAAKCSRVVWNDDRLDLRCRCERVGRSRDTRQHHDREADHPHRRLSAVLPATTQRDDARTTLIQAP